MLNKPINAYPYNCCVDATEGFRIEYEIPNNEAIDRANICVNDLKTGECVFEEYQDVSSSESLASKVVCDVDNLSTNKEYSWNSFYWKTPSSQTSPDKICTVTGIDNDGSIRIEPKAEPKTTFIPTYNEHPQFDNAYFYTPGLIRSDENSYNASIFKKCGHAIGEDTSTYCSTGVLEDYFGYTAFMIEGDFFKAIRSIGFGKCVINIYNNDILVSRARCLAYDYFGEVAGANYIVIVDNEEFMTNMSKTCDKIEVSYDQELNRFSKDIDCYQYSQAKFYNIDDFNQNEDFKGIISKDSESRVIKRSIFLDNNHEYKLYTAPSTSIGNSIKIGDKLSVWLHDNAEYNTTPTYYFRTKTSPAVSIRQFNLQSGYGSNVLNDIKCKFGINYNSSNSLNYFYLYLYVFNSQSNKWEIKERSPMLYNTNDTYEFIGFSDSQKYKVSGVCTDKDGDEWTTEEVEFTVTNSAISTYNTLATFNKEKTTIDVCIDEILDKYKTASVEFYKVLKNDMEAIVNLEYAGGGLAKSDGIVCFNKWSDYNIKNDSYYDYYVRVSYTGKESDADEGVDFYLVGTDIHTEFQGTSILGLKKISDVELSIAQSFNLLYHFDNNIGELTNEISREYVNSFNRYPKELKGHQNYISGSCSGLLGSEKNGIYEEPKGIRDVWKDFVNDDTIKLYRGLDGETMIISIDTSKVKPFYYPGVGLVNEIYITFKEISPTNQYAIFTTEKTG